MTLSTGESSRALESMESMNDLFEKPVPVRISKAGHEDRQEELSVRITLGSSRQNRNTRVGPRNTFLRECKHESKHLCDHLLCKSFWDCYCTFCQARGYSDSSEM